MIKSMTGYGRHQATVGGMDITVEIRSVNHRYYEFSARITKGYGFLEEKIKSYLQSLVSRGKIDVYVGIDTVDAVTAEILVNHSLAQGYLQAFHELAERYGIQNDVTVNTLARIPDLLTVHKAQESEDAVWANVQPVLAEAAARFVSMREREGERMRADVAARMESIAAMVEQVEQRSPQTVAEYREKLRAKLEEVLESFQLDEQRLLTEAAIYADRVAVDEETVRLRSHLEEMGQMLASGEPIGRKLDFVVQEVNRETNTIGSKAQDTEIARLVIEMKAEIEKIREQIQNIE